MGRLRQTAVLTSVAGLGWLLLKNLRTTPEANLTGQVALITGGTRGLGFLLAREFALAGCRLVICARDADELIRARTDLVQMGAEVLTVVCDVSDQTQVQKMVDEATRYFGRVDIVVNNAGIIQVGPVSTMTLADFEQAMGVMYWGVLYTTMAVLPQMLKRGYGRIVNITSIGGKVSVPHLMPYNSAKFAAVGLSQGLRMELRDKGIIVTTIVPGLMRTGSHLNALFNGRQQKEFIWFALGASLPFISMEAATAARQIVQATKRGEAERTLSLPAKALARLHGLFPALITEIFGLGDQFVLPGGNGAGHQTARGMEIEAQLPPRQQRFLELLTTLGRHAAERLHQYPGPTSVLDKATNGTRPHNSRDSQPRG